MSKAGGRLRLLRSPLIEREEFRMSEVDVDVLRNFFRKKYQTLGDLLTLNSEDGSRVMSSVQKLVSYGFVKRDWELEDRLKQDVIYAITKEGKDLVVREVENNEIERNS